MTMVRKSPRGAGTTSRPRRPATEQEYRQATVINALLIPGFVPPLSVFDTISGAVHLLLLFPGTSLDQQRALMADCLETARAILAQRPPVFRDGRRIPVCPHPERPHRAHGLCSTCENVRYRQTPEGRARDAKYEATPKARERKLLYEYTVRATMRAPKPTLNFRPRNPGAGFGPQPMYAVTTKDGILPFDGDTFDVRARYAQQVRYERACGLLSPMTFGELALACKRDEGVTE